MYSCSYCKLVSLVLTTCRKLGSSPLTFNSNTHETTVDYTVVPKLERNFYLVLVSVLSAMAIVLKYKLTKESNSFHLAVVCCIGQQLLVTVNSISAYFYRDICAAANGLTLLLRHLRCEYMPKFNPEKSMINKLLYGALLVVASGFTAMSVLFLLFLLFYPRLVFIGALIPEPYCNFPVLLAVYMFEGYVILVIFSGQVAALSYVLPNCFYFAYILKYHIRTGRRSYVSDDSLRIAVNIRLMYRWLQVLHANILRGCSLGLYLVGLNAIFMGTAIYLNVVLMGYWQHLSNIIKAPLVVGDCLTLGVWTFLLEMGCRFFVEGNKTLVSWKKHSWGCQQQNRLMHKFLRSCRPILFCYGRQFVVGPVSVFNFYRGVVRGTFRALLTIK